MPHVRSATPYRLRRAVLERDSYICRYCGNSRYPWSWLVAEHVDPLGRTEMSNLVAACRPCNKVKGGRTPDEAAMPLLMVGEVRIPAIPYARLYPYQLGGLA